MDRPPMPNRDMLPADFGGTKEIASFLGTAESARTVNPLNRLERVI